jgi:hypothetical protein
MNIMGKERSVCLQEIFSMIIHDIYRTFARQVYDGYLNRRI